MNIREELLKEKNHSKAQALKISEFACSSPKHFKELMQCFLSNEYRLAQRAAWSVSWAAKKNPDLIKRMIAEGHAVANHTMSHPMLAKLADVKLTYEIVTPRDIVKEIAWRRLEDKELW